MKTCPCCNNKISFRQLFKMWTNASKKDQELIKCLNCNQSIGDLITYEKYGLIGALPLFGMPLIYSNEYSAYLVSFASLIYALLLFWGLYKWVPLNCRESNNNVEIEIHKQRKKSESLTQLVVGIITIIFLGTVIWMFFSSAIEHKEKQKLNNIQDEQIELQNK